MFQYIGTVLKIYMYENDRKKYQQKNYKYSVNCVIISKRAIKQ